MSREGMSKPLHGAEERMLPGARPGQAPTPGEKAAIADRHEPPADLPKGGSSSTGPNVGPAGTSVMTAGYAGTTRGTISGSGTGTAAKPLGGSKTGAGNA